MEKKKHYWKALLVLIIIPVVFLFGYLVQLLWNGVVCDIFDIGQITFWQALGLLLLSKILFGSHPQVHKVKQEKMYHKKLVKDLDMVLAKYVKET